MLECNTTNSFYASTLTATNSNIVVFQVKGSCLQQERRLPPPRPCFLKTTLLLLLCVSWQKKALLLLGTTRVDEVGSVSSIKLTYVMEGQTTHTFTLAFILFQTSDLKRPPTKLGYCRPPTKASGPFQHKVATINQDTKSAKAVFQDYTTLTSRICLKTYHG